MSVVSVSNLFQGQSATFNSESGQYEGAYIVVTDDKDDGPQVVASAPGLPQKNSVYAFGNDSDSTAVLKELHPERIDGSRFLWKVTGRWEPLGQNQPKQQEDPEGNPVSDPVNFADQITMSQAKYTAPVIRATFRGTDPPVLLNPQVGDFVGVLQIGSEGPVRNTVGIEYNPPLEKELTQWVVRVSRYLTEFPAPIATNYRDAVNNDAFTLGTRAWPPFALEVQALQAKMESITGSPAKVNNYDVWRVTFEMHIGPFVRPPQSHWRAEVPNRGIHRLAKAGDPDGRGGTYSSADILDGVPEFIRIRDVEGNTIDEPILLNKDGQPLGENEDPLYLIWQVYPELPFFILGL